MPRPGPHELGQNLLTDARVAARVVELVPGPPLPIVEWAAGRGALTRGLAALGRPVEAVEIDRRSVARLRRILPPHVVVTRADILRHAPPRGRYDLVGNLPFALTTPALRRLVTLGGWRRAVLLLQWEVARKRAAVGGTTLLTAQWWPWFEFGLDRRVPAAAFRPRPSVDAGLLVVDRRESPLVDVRSRQAYQAFAARVFTGRGRDVRGILTGLGLPGRAVEAWRARHGVAPHALPRDLGATAWVAAYELGSRGTRSA